MIPNMEDLVNATRTPAHAHMLINTYFDNWPVDTTQEYYKKHGAYCSQYWYNELKRILTAKIHFTPEFTSLPHMEYYVDKYNKYTTNTYMNIAEIDKRDREDLLHAFVTQLGMYWSLFPFTINDF